MIEGDTDSFDGFLDAYSDDCSLSSISFGRWSERAVSSTMCKTVGELRALGARRFNEIYNSIRNSASAVTGATVA